VDDGVNLVSWYTRDWPFGCEAIAVTSTLADFAQRILDSDMTFNDADFEFDTEGAPGKMDVEAVTTHEAGHYFGLGHSSDPEATMFPSTGPANLGPRSLAADDQDGVCDLYPAGRPPGLVKGEACGAGGSCEGDLLCLGAEPDGYCTGRCAWRDDCPEGLFCVEAEDYGPLCLRFPPEAPPGAELGDACGPGGECQLGLVCLREAGAAYCSGECDVYAEPWVRRDCPPGWRCAERRGGRLACIPAPPDAGADAADAGGDAGDAGDATAGAPPAGPPAEAGWCSARGRAAGAARLLAAARR
jgi:hypothetical protein